uniref:Uncharacterized protein n=1 Tax=Physcomitrium patens TaxID=3218 RepID=A0A2K1L9L7_PHYPA|nr:hypothetical protein PHYPA_001153 [Physcomitrium patens]
MTHKSAAVGGVSLLGSHHAPEINVLAPVQQLTQQRTRRQAAGRSRREQYYGFLSSSDSVTSAYLPTFKQISGEPEGLTLAALKHHVGPFHESLEGYRSSSVL